MQSPRPLLALTRRLSFRDGRFSANSRVVPEEVPVAISYAGSSHAVMMATPGDLEDFAVGFSLTEGIIGSPDEIAEIEVVETGMGIDIQISLNEDVTQALRARKRSMAGPVGCGLCGIESIEQAVRKVPQVSSTGLALAADDLPYAISLLNRSQPLHRETRAVHGAGFYVPGQGLVATREDVGRHNALDKLCGAVVRAGGNGAKGAVVVTSRISVEMVQKTAILGSPVLVAISAPTALAIRTAEEAGMTLVGLVRGNDYEIFTGESRISFPATIGQLRHFG
ncbi:formate dehydrogenase accessory sulfurtransferase FdhD (plasmid) [Rhizobium grahamii]|uniref:Sulfur carrier protein FdhD n=1 Tax=Rhizobium grahamii TaxID=1120045 RepID=A0A5Q0C9B3_9HYPH|nr:MULTISPECIES: formate dehydrogenase accessory sulfurtransferase FdhD [Rhizobium]QFY62558.1 formate dehydrogenase accessory sulfurtransferase FdhD [Rhizobium grahamii]QRM52702.1 formate dehydrogenase accessory sulfurtransferase FdhD [Rhizobium sp. BG6]